MNYNSSFLLIYIFPGVIALSGTFFHMFSIYLMVAWLIQALIGKFKSIGSSV